MFKPLLPALCLLLFPGTHARPQVPDPSTSSRRAASLGLFTGTTDIGAPLRGSAEFDALRQVYRVGGGGADMWGRADSFRFVWTRVGGDAVLSARVHVDAPVSQRLAKGVLMFRESLDPGSPYADVALHADGHLTLQYRLTPGGETRDVLLPAFNTQELRLVRRGNTFFAYAGSAKPMQIAIPLARVAYVGLGVCSHNTDVLQHVTFSGVTLSAAAE